MVTIRRFEEQCKREADAGKLSGMHSSVGQEAVPTGICAHLRTDDYVLGNHRSHHHCIAKGVDINEMMAELLGKVTGTNRGKGGTMHIADIGKGMLGANGVVGSNIPVTTGAALSAKLKGEDTVSVVFFGDGASGQGALHESMNLAGIWKLGVDIRVREQPLRRGDALRVLGGGRIHREPAPPATDSPECAPTGRTSSKCTRWRARRCAAPVPARGPL